MPGLTSRQGPTGYQVNERGELMFPVTGKHHVARARDSGTKPPPRGSLRLTSTHTAWSEVNERRHHLGT